MLVVILTFTHFYFKMSMFVLYVILDTKKMPLGKISKSQLAKGFDVLDELEKAVKAKSKGPSLSELSSKFYTVIPHSFGRNVPPVINTMEMVRSKNDMLLVSYNMYDK